MNNIGLYLHVPFCKSKCGYCDFYSLCGNSAKYDEYTSALQKRILFFGERFSRAVDSVYFGGGTPSVLEGDRIAELLETVKKAFSLSKNAEITLEANPADNLFETLEKAKKAGVNRLSLGVQSGVEEELEILGRRHKNADVIRTISDARKVGIDNISLDLMLGIPNQTIESLDKSIDFVLSRNPSHISAYILKIEEGTPFSKIKSDLNLPSEEETAEMYLHTVKRLEGAGLFQYEISNFSKKGFESRHNLKYWQLDEYLGLGPAAHSFMEGKRFFFPRSTEEFICGCEPVFDGEGGTEEEFIMLSLRLREGLCESSLFEKYGIKPTEEYKKFTERLISVGYAKRQGDRLALTPKGFLVQNEIITELYERLI